VLVEVFFIHACTFTTSNYARYRLKVNQLLLSSRARFLCCFTELRFRISNVPVETQNRLRLLRSSAETVSNSVLNVELLNRCQ
jgi:hypothetical protein